MSPAEKASLGDWFALNVLSSGRFPLTLDELIAQIDERNSTADGLDRQEVFVISEAGQIRWTPANSGLRRPIRYAIARGRAGDFSADVLISTRPPATDKEAFLQVAAWDPGARHFNFYERIGVGWFWEGNSWMAFSEATAGKGPFDSHANGAPVMKELNRPWLHWESNSQSIPKESFPPDHPIHSERFFDERQPAHLLEVDIVRPAVKKWIAARLDRVLGDPAGIEEPKRLLRHLTHSTSVNLVSSETRSAAATPDIDLPFEFFLDRDLLLNTLDLQPDIARISVSRDHYAAAIQALGVSLRSGAFEQAGETFFAWPVPSRAFEDLAVIDELMRRRVVSRRLVLCVAMIDFTNPLRSRARESILDFAPQGPTPAQDLEAVLLHALETAPPGSPGAAAHEALRLSESELVAQSMQRIEAYWRNLVTLASTREGVEKLMRLADDLRRAFRRRPISEFDLTLPHSNLPQNSPELLLTENAEVVEVTN